MSASADIDARVAQALTIATGENGFSFAHCEAEDIAGDLLAYDADFEDYRLEDLVPGVRLWMQGAPSS